MKNKFKVIAINVALGLLVLLAAFMIWTAATMTTKMTLKVYVNHKGMIEVEDYTGRIDEYFPEGSIYE